IGCAEGVCRRESAHAPDRWQGVGRPRQSPLCLHHRIRRPLMSVATRGQKMAQEAFACVQARGAVTEEYRSFAREFPTLVHQCGVAQAVAFARAKAPKSEAHRHYSDDLAAVLTKAGHTDIATA